MNTNTKKISRALLSFLTFFIMGPILYGCAPATQVTSSWKSPEATAKAYNNGVVAAMTDDVQARQVIEQKLQNQLQQRGIKATKSIDLFPPTAANRQGDDPDMMLERIQGDGYDGILTVALLDEETETRYVPGTAAFAPITRFGWYGSFRGYYTYYRPTLYQPGYYTENQFTSWSLTYMMQVPRTWYGQRSQSHTFLPHLSLSPATLRKPPYSNWLKTTSFSNYDSI